MLLCHQGGGDVQGRLDGGREDVHTNLQTGTPYQAWRLGRNVTPSDEAVWLRNVCAIAYHVTYQKF